MRLPDNSFIPFTSRYTKGPSGPFGISAAGVHRAPVAQRAPRPMPREITSFMISFVPP